MTLKTRDLLEAQWQDRRLGSELFYMVWIIKDGALQRNAKHIKKVTKRCPSPYAPKIKARRAGSSIVNADPRQSSLFGI